LAYKTVGLGFTFPMAPKKRKRDGAHLLLEANLYDNPTSLEWRFPLHPSHMPTITNCKTLTHLTLSGCGLTCAHIKCLVSDTAPLTPLIPHLNFLNVRDNPINNTGCVTLSRLPTLMYLNVGNCGIQAMGVRSLANLGNLITLVIDSNPFSNVGIGAIVQWKARASIMLMNLDVSGIVMTTKSLKDLVQGPRLECQFSHRATNHRTGKAQWDSLKFTYVDTWFSEFQKTLNNHVGRSISWTHEVKFDDYVFESHLHDYTQEKERMRRVAWVIVAFCRSNKNSPFMDSIISIYSFLLQPLLQWRRIDVSKIVHLCRKVKF
jgi:hypothetical protein